MRFLEEPGLLRSQKFLPVSLCFTLRIRISVCVPHHTTTRNQQLPARLLCFALYHRFAYLVRSFVKEPINLMVKNIPKETSLWRGRFFFLSVGFDFVIMQRALPYPIKLTDDIKQRKQNIADSYTKGKESKRVSLPFLA